MDSGVWNAEVVFFKLKKLGYEGGITLVKDYMRPKRPLRKSKATVRFETLPGAQMQSDWGKMPARIAGVPATAHFCVNTLGFSRRSHFWITDCEDAAHTAEAQQRAFAHFAGVPSEVLVDNQKAAVIEHRMKNGRTERVVFNESWLDFLAHYGSVGPHQGQLLLRPPRGRLARALQPTRGSMAGRGGRSQGARHHRPGGL